LDYLILLCQIT